MEKRKLTDIDKARLLELVKEYVMSKEKIAVSGNGGIVVKKGVGLLKFLPIQVEDFSTVVIAIVDKIIEAKKEIKYVQNLCSDAISSLVTTNQRDFIIKRLYTAHLVDEDPEIDRTRDEIEIDFEVVHGRDQRSKKLYVGGKISVAEQIANLLNNSDNYIVFDK